MPRPMFLAMLAPAAVMATVATAHAAEPIAGQWLTVGGDAIVTIQPCGQAMCGRITRIVHPDPQGDGTDRRNPDPALRPRKLLGLEIIPSFTDAGKDWRGTIYSPQAGKSYKAYLAKQPDGSLKVTGCIAAFLCQNQQWTPAK